MAIDIKKLEKNAKKPAVTCCRFEEGTVLEAKHFEDPGLFADLEDSNLLTIPSDSLTLGQVVGAKLTKTVDALSPLTPGNVEGFKAASDAAPAKAEQAPAATAPAAPEAIQGAVGGNILINIGKGENISLSIPTGIAQSMGVATGATAPAALAAAPKADKELRSLTKQFYKIDDVKLGSKTEIKGTKLTVRKDIVKDAIASEELVADLSFEIIPADKYDVHSETIMDIQPIATKIEGELGQGKTAILDGVVMVVTGTDEKGVQIGEFGSSEGILEKNIMWGRPGAADRGEFLIKAQVTVKEGTNMERPGPLAAHRACDYITQEIREVIKAEVASMKESKKEEYKHIRRPSKKKIVIIKEIMGQGAMHDNLILPVEPSGILGAVANVDLGNVPVMLSPTEILDGAVHALTCIGPASKENSRHYFREPLVMEALNSDEFDLAGVILVGSPQANSEKFYVSKRLGMMVEAMDADGAIITTEGFGNNHIDFASHIEQMGQRGISTVGVTYSAIQGALVVGNEYMTHMIDNNKSSQGIENEILSNNTLTQEDAIRALAMLNAAMEGIEVEEADRRWNPAVKQANVDAIKAAGFKIELTDNEQVLAKSKKRLELYEAE